jgi:hypothetical protein
MSAHILLVLIGTLITAAAVWSAWKPGAAADPYCI